MTQATLPVLGGGERELRDGDRVRLRCGIDLTIKSLSGAAFYCAEMSCAWSWGLSGRHCGDQHAIDIVLILGPAEQPHDDGTVTKLCTLPVTMESETWLEYQPVGVGRWVEGEPVLCGDGRVCDQRHVRSEVCNRFGYLQLCDITKPAPSPTYTERLIEAVKKGEVRLPLKATRMKYIDNVNGGVWLCENPGEGGSWSWPQYALGPLPPWQPGDETSIDLATVREAADKK